MLTLFTKAQICWAGVRERARVERGASAVEYGLLVALIAAVIVLIVASLGQKVQTAFSSVDSNI